MLISFLKKGVYGYLRDDHLGIYSFVSNNNLAVRKAVALRAGGYREPLRIGEDYDLCQRVAAMGGLVYFCPEVSLEHRARDTTRALLRQWWSYGFHLARNHRHFHPGRIFLAGRPPRWEDREAAEPVRASQGHRARARRPTLFVYLSAFVVMNLALAVAGLSLVFLPRTLSTAAAVAAGVAILAYVRPDFRHLSSDGLRTAVGLCALRYLVNLCFVGAGFAGGLTRGSFYLLPPIATRVGPARKPCNSHLEGEGVSLRLTDPSGAGAREPHREGH